MWRGLIVAAMIAWSQTAFAGARLGIRTADAIDIIKAAVKTDLKLNKCSLVKGSMSRTCDYAGEKIDGRESFWTFESSGDGYLEAIWFGHTTGSKEKTREFLEDRSNRAWEFISVAIVVASQDALGEIDRKLVGAIGSYVMAGLLEKPLPKRPDGYQAKVLFGTSGFVVTIKRVDD